MDTESISVNMEDVKRRIARAAERGGRSTDDVTIVAVTKTMPIETIAAALEAGIHHIGENRVQEAADKVSRLAAISPMRPTWHMVGHLQRNKVKTALDIFDIIHSIDSLRLAEAVSSSAQRAVPVLLQVNVSEENTKGGLSATELDARAAEIARLPNLELRGLMTIAPLTGDPEEVRPVFRKLRKLRDSLGLKHLSMGMSDDFEVAVEEGATIVRLGRVLFGERR